MRMPSFALLLGLSLFAGCDSSRELAGPDAGFDAQKGSHDAALADSGPSDGGPADDAGPDPRDAGPDPRSDAGTSSDAGEDGPPIRQACSEFFGDRLNRRFGRLDGTLVSIVLPHGPRKCHGDDDHIHL